MAYPFYFSYAHNDLDNDQNVKKFYKEVSRWVRLLTGSKSDGLLDSSALRAGDVWDKALGSELRSIGAMVCLYSPSFFSSNVCAQELQVFLERRLKHKREHPGNVPAAVIPVLWVPHPVPVSVPDFQYEYPKADIEDLDKDAKENVAYLAQFGETKAFEQFAWRVAKRVKEATRGDRAPLADLGFDPVLTGVGSAFEPPSLPPAAFGPGARVGTECVTYVYADTLPWNQWPFAPIAKALLHTSAAAAKARELFIYELTFNPTSAGLDARMDEVRNKDHAQILLVDGSTLVNADIVSRLAEYDGRGLDACAAVIAWPPGSRTAVTEAAVATAFPKQRLREAPYFYPAIESPDAFVNAVTRSLAALQNDVMANRRVVPSQAPTSDFAKVPGVSGPGGQRAA